MNFSSDREFMECAIEDDLVIDVSTCMLNEGNENEAFSYVFDDGTTPVKECGDLVYNGENKKRLLRESALQVKRRRMLEFESEVSPYCNEKIPHRLFGLQETDNSLDMAVSELSQWVSSFTESTSASCSDVLDLSSEEWVAECFNDPDVYLTVDETYESGNNPPRTADGHQGTTELDNKSFPEDKEVPDQPLCARKNVLLKGKNSSMNPPSNLPSSVAYPFDIIKPCGIHGDVTLKDINQKILTPQPKSKPKDEDRAVPYPRSALTGKPVVGKTKIRTEGGTGSITIMRTKG